MDIQQIFTDALDRLGIAWRRMNRKNIAVARREAVAPPDEFAGPNYRVEVVGRSEFQMRSLGDVPGDRRPPGASLSAGW